MSEEEEIELDYSMPPTECLLDWIKKDDEVHLIECTGLILDCVTCCELKFINEAIIPAIKKLAHHQNTKIAGVMLVNLPDIAETLYDYFPENREGIIMGGILPIFHDLIDANKIFSTKDLAEAYGYVCILLSPANFAKSELRFLLKAVSNSSKTARTFVGITLSFLSDCFDEDIWYSQFHQMITIFSTDGLGSIRSLIPNLISIYQKKVKDIKHKTQLSARFLLLCSDSSVSVRKSAAEALVALSDSLDENTRLIHIIPATETFLNDSSAIVKNTYLKNLGPLISSIGTSISTQLVSQYCTVLTATDTNNAYAAAFSFPAVAIALGRDRINEVLSALESAITSKDWRIRRTLSYGLVSFAHLLSPDDIQRYASIFLNDLSNVAIGVITNLYQIVRFIDHKEDLLFCLQNPMKRYKEWRTRIKVSEQLRYCSEDFDRSALYEIAKELIFDPVIVVRKDAVLSFAHLMKEEYLSDIKNFAKSENFRDRWIVALAFSYLDDSFASKEIETLLTLCQDSCKIVLIAASISLNAVRYRVTDKKQELQDMIEKLKTTRDPDILASFV